MLDLTTRELGRIATEAVAHRDATARPWIAVYGGALHNDRFPEPGVEDWSYAEGVDDATHGHFVEIDLIVPELAEDDKASAAAAVVPAGRARRTRGCTCGSAASARSWSCCRGRRSRDLGRARGAGRRGLGAAAALQLVLWLVQQRTQNAGIVDVGWAARSR